MGSDGSRACQYRLSSGDQASSAAPYHALRRLDERRAVQLGAQPLGLRVREWPFRPKAPSERTNHHAVRAGGSTEHMVAGRECLGMHAQKAKSAEAYRNSFSIS